MALSEFNWQESFKAAVVIPAHPLALTETRKLDERRQRAMARYYLAAGVGGGAVGVHTTQFQIRDPKVGLYEPVLALAAEELAAHGVIRIAGVCGRTAQAAQEAMIACRLEYNAALLSTAALAGASIEEPITHVRAIGEIIPIIGLSPGQAEALDRVTTAYPHLTDHEFVRENLDGGCHEGKGGCKGCTPL